MKILWYIFAAAAAGFIAAVLWSKTKIHIDTAKDGKNEFDVRILILGVRVIMLRAKLELEGYINPRLDIGFREKTFHLYLFEQQEGAPVKSLNIEKLCVKAQIGVEDAAALALIVGFVNVIGRMYAKTAGRPDWNIGAIPVFGKEVFRITGNCIISVRIADIIIASVGKKIKKARKK